MKSVWTLLIVVSIVLACNKKIIDRTLATTDRFENFDYLWNEVDKKYSYFDVKSIDWNQIRSTYRSQISEDMSDVEFFQVLKHMLNELKDDHTNLIAPFDVSVYNFGDDYIPQYYGPLINSMFPDLMRTSGFSHSKVPNTNLAYIRFSSFMSPINEQALDWMLQNYQSTDGLIFDVRGNGGGLAASVGVLIARFINTKVLVGYEQMRNGTAHDSFSTPMPIYIQPKGTYYSKPVIVLTDKGSYSATTFFAMCTKAIPTMKTMGEATGGGGGLPNGGQLPNGWTYRFSITRLLDANKVNYAESGVPVDFPVQFDTSDMTIDEVINAAIQELQ